MIYHSDTCLLHNPVQEFGGSSFRPYPEQPDRVLSILNDLQSRGINTTEPKQFDLNWIEKIHDFDYMQFILSLEKNFPGSTDEISPTAFNIGGEITSTSSFYAKLGHYLFDPSTPLVPQTGRAAIASVNCVLQVANDLGNGEILSGALCRPPGHHAMADRGGGYCIFNNVAIAANYLTEKGKDITVLDLDYHHGNGTQQLFYSRDDVQYVSIHADTHSNYPFYWGFEEQQGVLDGKGFTTNLPVPNTVSEDSYLDRLNEAITIVKEYQPDIVLVSMGFDCYIDDPIAGLSLTTQSYSRIGDRLQDFSHLGIVLEGGYAVDDIGQCFGNLYEAIEG